MNLRFFVGLNLMAMHLEAFSRFFLVEEMDRVIPDNLKHKLSKKDVGGGLFL